MKEIIGETMKEAVQSVERRTKEKEADNFPNDRVPTAEELKVSLDRTEPGTPDPMIGFFSGKGPLFTACWELHNLAKGPEGIDGVKDEDIAFRLKNIFEKFNRPGDAAPYILEARKWFKENNAE